MDYRNNTNQQTYSCGHTCHECNGRYAPSNSESPNKYQTQDSSNEVNCYKSINFSEDKLPNAYALLNAESGNETNQALIDEEAEHESKLPYSGAEWRNKSIRQDILNEIRSTTDLEPIENLESVLNQHNINASANKTPKRVTKERFKKQIIDKNFQKLLDTIDILSGNMKRVS